MIPTPTGFKDVSICVSLLCYEQDEVQDSEVVFLVSSEQKTLLMD